MANKKKIKSDLKLKEMQKAWKRAHFKPKCFLLSKKFINQPSISVFTKVQAWLDEQYNLEDLKLLADIAGQEKPLSLNTNLSIEEINNLTDVGSTNTSNLNEEDWKSFTI